MESLKINIERINTEFKDNVFIIKIKIYKNNYLNTYMLIYIFNLFTYKDKTTFVAVCIPEFLSMYETERLTQDLYKNGIDIRNVIINQVLFEEGDCNMCKSRIKMQKKYLDQIRDLFDDFHITIIPLQNEEVRGNDLNNFSKMLIEPPKYKY